MPFDAGMFSATVNEIQKYVIGAKVEKISFANSYCRKDIGQRALKALK